MKGLENDSFRRFAIAYGLSFVKGQGPEIGLPSQLKETQLVIAELENDITPRDKEIV